MRTPTIWLLMLAVGFVANSAYASLDLVANTGGWTYGAAADGDRLLMAVGYRLNLMDISDPETPEVLADMPLTMSVSLSALGPDFAAVIQGNYQLRVYSSSGPDLLADRGDYLMPSRARGLQFGDGVLYVSSEDSLYAFPLSEETGLGAPHVQASQWINRLARCGTLLYAASQTGDLRCFDVQNPGSPELLSEVATGGALDFLDCSTTLVYAANYDWVKAYDSSDPDTLVARGEWQAPPQCTMYGMAVLDSAVFCEYTYHQDGLLRDRIVTLEHSADNELTPQDSLQLEHKPTMLFTNEGRLYAREGGFGVRLMRPSDNDGLVFEALISLGQMPLGMLILDHTVYLSGDHGLAILDISDPNQPHELSYYFCNATDAIAHRESRVYLALDNPPGILTLDVADPANPQPVAFTPTAATPRDLHVWEDYLYSLQSTHPKMVAYSLVEQDSLTLIHVWQDWAGETGLFSIADGSVMINDGLVVLYGLANPPSFNMLGYVSLGTDSMYSKKFGDLLLASGGNINTNVYIMELDDISDPANPIELDHFTTPTAVWDFDLADGVLYLARGRYMESYEYSTPPVRTPLDVLDLIQVRKVVAAGEYVHVLSSAEGFSIYESDYLTGLPDGRAVRPAGLGLACQPNPFNGSSLLSYTLEYGGMVALAVYDLRGVKVHESSPGWQGPGSYRIPLDCTGLASGVYFCELECGTLRGSTKILLVN